MCRATLDMRRRFQPRRFERLCLAPDFVIYNAQMRNFVRLPLVLWIWPGDPFASIRVLQHPDLVPNDPTHIKLVEEQSYPALRISIDGGTVPANSPRWRYTIPVEIAR